MKRFIKNTLLFILGVLLLLSLSLVIYLKKDEMAHKKTDVGQKWLNTSTKKERCNILLLGVDRLPEEKNSEKSRTDTIMILSIDPVTKSGYILSIPRDTRVQLDGHNGHTRINAAHVRGGIELAVSTVKNLTDLPIHHYVRVDYDALKKTVDDIGGIEINIAQQMDYDDDLANLHIHFSPGVQLLDGKRAEEYLRFRSGYQDKDLGRINVQQQFIKAVAEKMLSPESLKNIPKYLETFEQYVTTDMSKKEMISVAATAAKIDTLNIERKTIAGAAKTINGNSYYIVDKDELKEQIAYLQKGKYNADKNSPEYFEKIKSPKLTEKDGEPSALDKLLTKNKNENKKIIISVFNGCGKKGAANRVEELLKIRNIEVTYTGNASNFDCKKTVIYYKDDENLAEEIKKILETGEIREGTKKTDYREPDIAIMIGSDFDKY